MSSDTLHALSGLIARLRQLELKAERLVTLRDRLRTQGSQIRKQIDHLDHQSLMLDQTGQGLRKLMDLLINDQVEALRKIVGEGLEAIFHDLDLSFEAELVPKHGKVWIEFYIREGKPENPLSIRGKPLDSFGGGPCSVASLIIRLMTMVKLKRIPILVLDESLGAVSEEYVERTGHFLRQLAKETGIDVLLVTHKQGYVTHANRAYRCVEVVEGGRRHLTLRGA